MLKWRQSRCEVAQKEPVRRGRIVQTRSTWKHVWILLVSAEDVTLMKFWRQLPESELQECEVFKWRRRYKKVIHADSHQHENAPRSQEKQSTAKNCDTRDAMRVSEHYVSTPCTRTQRLIKSMMSKCRTRQPESFDRWLFVPS